MGLKHLTCKRFMPAAAVRLGEFTLKYKKSKGKPHE
jgi:hypothetical protein